MLKRFWRRFRRNYLALAGLVVLAGFAFTAVAAPLITPYDPYALHPEAQLTGPSASHWFGTDQLSRDLFSRVLYGSRISFKVAGIAVGIALLLGTIIGVCAGHFGGWTDIGLSRLVDGMFSLPDIILALVIMAILGEGTMELILAIGIVYTPIFARVARGSTLAVKEMPYVEAARCLGSGNLRIIVRHLLPNIAAPLIVQTTLSFAFAILAEAALSFLGLGVEPDAPSWGIMLKDGKDWMEQAWWIAIFPGIAISLAVLAFNVVGDGLRDSLDPEGSAAAG